MTKSELITKLATSFPALSVKDAELAVKTILEVITRQLEQGGRVEIRGFGTFSLSTRVGRIGRNPKTGDKVEVPPKKVPHFKPGKELRDRVDQHYQASKASQS